MKIVGAEILVLDIPMVNKLTVSFGDIKSLKPLIIRLTDELGNIGYGESILLPYPMTNFEFFETGLVTLRKFILPLILHKEIPVDSADFTRSIESFIALYGRVKGFEMTKAGVENAFIHILTQRLNRGMYELLETKNSKIPVGVSLSIPKDVDELGHELKRYRSSGFQRFKLKISKGNDVELIKAAREILPDGIITVDANCGYDLETFMKIVPTIDENSLEMVEQPFVFDDLISNIELKKTMKTKLCVDESITRFDHLEKYLKYAACDIVNLKIGRVGGAYSAYKMNKFCEKNGIRTWVGGLIETDIGRSFNLAIAGMTNCAYHHDFSPWNEYYSDFLVKNPYSIVGGNISIDLKAKGIGFEIDEEKLQRYNVGKYVIEISSRKNGTDTI